MLFVHGAGSLQALRLHRSFFFNPQGHLFTDFCLKVKHLLWHQLSPLLNAIGVDWLAVTLYRQHNHWNCIFNLIPCILRYGLNACSPDFVVE